MRFSPQPGWCSGVAGVPRRGRPRRPRGPALAAALLVRGAGMRGEAACVTPVLSYRRLLPVFLLRLRQITNCSTLFKVSEGYGRIGAER